MSLNWKEIDVILGELQLQGSFLREIYQPTYDSLVFELYNNRRKFKLFFSFSASFWRVHTLTKSIKNPDRPPRFASFLRSYCRNGKIVEVYQMGEERIIKIRVQKGENTIILWVRLWEEHRILSLQI